MSSADIFMTPTHSACCFPSAIIAYNIQLRNMGLFFKKSTLQKKIKAAEH